MRFVWLLRFVFIIYSLTNPIRMLHNLILGIVESLPA